MTRHHKEPVYQDEHGTFWARYNGKRRTLNTQKDHEQLLEEMKADAERAQATDTHGESKNGLEIIILRGLPGSGKTTWAKAFIKEQSWYKRISRDDLRAMLDNGRYHPYLEKFVIQLRNEIIRQCLNVGKSVIIDDTNLKSSDLSEIKQMAFAYDILERRSIPVPFRIIEFFDVPLNECIRRDALRLSPVGEVRIRELHNKYMQG